MGRLPSLFRNGQRATQMLGRGLARQHLTNELAREQRNLLDLPVTSAQALPKTGTHPFGVGGLTHHRTNPPYGTGLRLT